MIVCRVMLFVCVLVCLLIPVLACLPVFLWVCFFLSRIPCRRHKQRHVYTHIYHDVADKEVAYSQAVELAKHWQNGELRTTNGLGHRRILRDETFIREIIDFIHRRESIAVGEAVA